MSDDTTQVSLLLACGRCGAKFAEFVAYGRVDVIAAEWDRLHYGTEPCPTAAFTPPVPEDVRMRQLGAPSLPGFA